APAPAPAPAAAPPAATPAPAPASPPTQTAALPPPAPPPALPRSALSVVFDGGASDLPESAEATVNDLAQRMRANETLRLQLRSYASGTAETAREARQLSLARALALRERLSAFGIRSTRIDIRALGNGAADGPPDRIDVEFLN
ncbi:OmpA family protein, partial [Azospirillum sp.]|uniref:OmpA family protein n=1 Tax=Azospirillum sp. TaxID=34012 RepID=UPI003D708A70